MIHQDISAIRAQLSDSGRKLADLTANMVYEKPELIRPMLDLTWLDEEPWSQRASRIVSICGCEYPELIRPYISEIITGVITKKSEGARRNFLKIFVERDIKIKLRDRSLLLNSCFDFLTGNYSVAVKVYSMDIIYKLSNDLPDVRKELYEILCDRIDESSAGYRSRALKIIKKIENPVNYRRSGNDANH